MKNTGNPTKHPPDEQLVAWMDAPEDLHSQDVQAIEAHVANCDQCTARMETLSLLETGLQALKNAAPQPTSYFRAQVMAALPRDLYAGAAERGRGFRVWVSEQVAALLFLLAGVVYFVLSADALASAAQWWSDSQAWLGTSTGYDATWLGNSPSGALEAQLGLIPGALLLGIGAFVFLVTNIKPQGRAFGRRDGKVFGIKW